MVATTADRFRSALLEGEVLHRRLTPVPHAFRYRLYMHRLDLEELPVLDRALRLFGVNRRAVVGYRASDHLVDVRALVQAHGISEALPRIELVTHCRVFGYVFNPVSFYLCYDASDALRVVVCEVHNTFGETHNYVLPVDAGGREWRDNKVFRVSPFLTVDGTYRFRINVSEKRFDAHIDLFQDGRVVLVSRLSLARRTLSDRALAGMLLKFPLMTAKIIGAIHWQALRLWMKGVRV